MTDATSSIPLMEMTVQIVAAFVPNAGMNRHDLPELIAATYGALAKLGAEPVPEVIKPVPVVPIRGSIKPHAITSLIDGKPYKMLRRHLTLNGHTPQSYRAAYGLPADYPMVCADYAAKRKELALKTGLGRKPGTKVPRKAKAA